MRRLRLHARLGAALLVGAAGLAVAIPTTPALGATGGGGCQMSGTANFDGTGLSLTPGDFAYNFTGSLTGCSASSTAPATGTVLAGKAYQVTQSYACGTSTCSATYALPEPTGSGSCAQSTTGGYAVALWPDNTATVVNYTTTGALAAVELQGSVVPSVTMVLVSSTGGTPPPPPTISTGPDYPVGDGAFGQLVFSVSDPSACQTGVTSAGISGLVGFGAAQ